MTSRQTNNKDKVNFLNYDKEREYCRKFLTEFKETGSENSEPKYMKQVQLIKNKELTDLTIHLEDIEDYFRGDQYKNFVKGVKRNTKRYLSMFGEAANALEVERTTEKNADEDFDDHINSFRLENLEKLRNNNSNNQQLDAIGKILRKNFDVFIVPGPNYKKKISKLRDLKANRIGSLVNVKATVVKVTEVQPLIDLACYICEQCACESYVKVNSRQFTPPSECNSEKCKTNRIKGNLVQNFAMSKFVPFQEIKIQETSEETPVGSVPRTFTLYARNNNVRQCIPGDIVNVTGTFLTKSNNRRFNSKDTLLQETYIEASKIQKTKQVYADLKLTEEDIKKLEDDSKTQGIGDKLVNSIAPEIYGMNDVKKALLVMLAGGSNLDLPDGMKIRGDLNLALIGDPGVAKSQLLKYVSNLTPRGVYTTGKGSTGAGLTATISRDPVTSEITLEGGALVLSDMGVCCIDEFDKMNETDRTSIHEVMEQQTISLAKAGITTSLNARTSILVAANPVYGRYDRSITPHANINLPHSLLSRFDLMFILLDKHNNSHDERLAGHITSIHQGGSIYNTSNDLFKADYLRKYIAHAKTFNPTINPELHSYITEKYLEKRKKNKEPENAEYDYITPRTLLAMIRLSQGLAKLRFSHFVEKEDIDGALELVEKAQACLNTDEDETGSKRTKLKNNKSSVIFKLIKNIFRDNKISEISIDNLQRDVTAKGYTVEDFNKTLDFYERTKILMRSEDGNKISLLN